MFQPLASGLIYTLSGRRVTDASPTNSKGDFMIQMRRGYQIDMFAKAICERKGVDERRSKDVKASKKLRNRGRRSYDKENAENQKEI